MNENTNDFEIMAPVSSRGSLVAVINAGANSVYFGIGKLNMRSHSANHFTIDDLRKTTETRNAKGVQIYLTVSTVIYGEGIETMHEVINAAKAANITAVIASDVAVMMYCRQVGVEAHLSTRLNISNINTLKFYAQLADVAVLACELGVDQVREIHEQIIKQNVCGPKGRPIRIGMFCHGAFCMAISGKCYMSLYGSNCSANRGACTQICRRSYTVTGNEASNQLEIDSKCIMSPKDLKGVRSIDKMMDMGVRMLKIEGRARGPEYVHTVVSCYKETIESVLDGTFTEERKDQWDERLSTVFNHGFWDGYYQGQKMGEWTEGYGSKAIEKKILIGKMIKCFSRLGVAKMAVEANTFVKEERLLITGSNTDAMFLGAEEIRYDLNPVDKAEQGWRVSIPVPDKVHPNGKLSKLVTK